MLLKDNKKKLMTIITSKIGNNYKDEVKSEVSEEHNTDELELKHCGEEVLNAILAKEPIRLAKALKKLLNEPKKDESESDLDS